MEKKRIESVTGKGRTNVSFSIRDMYRTRSIFITYILPFFFLLVEFCPWLITISVRRILAFVTLFLDTPTQGKVSVWDF